MEQALRTIRTNKSSTLLWRKKPLKIKDQLIQKVPPAQTRGDDKKRSSRKYHHSLTNVIYPNYNANFLLGGYTSLSPQIFFDGRHTAKSIATRVTKNDKTDFEKAQSLAYWTFLHVRPQTAAPTTRNAFLYLK
jgi:hypothetical protein